MRDFSKILEVAQRTVSIEIQALQQLLAELGPDFLRAVELIHACEGRVVVTGIGKSAIVAQKIVATMNSTGTLSLYMHAADAIHGDLGMIRPEDIILCLSKSGNTPEIKVLVPFVRRLGNSIIGMTANQDSFLAQQADVTLITPIDQEADPNNLAPTASTTAQMALGDALAVSLLSLRGFTPEDFAQFHPGGSLGKQLYLTVRDLAANNPLPAVLPTASLEEVILEITAKRLGATAVINGQQLLGIITDGDLRRMLGQGHALQTTTITATDIMTTQPKSIPPDMMAVEALQLMQSMNINQLVVLNDKKEYVGMIHLHDLIREGLV